MTPDPITGPWQTHPGGTADIGGVAHISSRITAIPGSGAFLIECEGNADPGPDNYPCTMFYCSRPILSEVGCTFSFSLCFGSTSPSAMNAAEFDCMFAMVCADGNTRLFNGSAQWLPGVGWMVADADGNWIPTGYDPEYLPNVTYPVAIEHTYDLDANTITTIIGGVSKTKPATPTEWRPGFVNVQVQPSSKPAGAYWAELWSKIQLEWS